MNVETWNRILFNSEQQRKEDVTSNLTDLELSVYECLQDDLLQEDIIESFGAKIESGDFLTLNMSDLEKMSSRSTYRPLPI